MYGKNALAGSQFYADKHKQTIVEAKLTATDVDMSATITKSFTENFTDQPDKTVALGYVSALLWQGILEKACAAGDLTLDGVVAASKKVTKLDTTGLAAPLDFSKPSEPSTRSSFVLKPDATAVGRLKTVKKARVNAQC